MTNYNNGQIHGWNGGECPVHPETVVNYWTREGRPYTNKAQWVWWDHVDDSIYVIAFQVVKAYVEPKVIWVNEYADGTCWAGFDEETAKMCATMDATRIAVKYVEVDDE